MNKQELGPIARAAAKPSLREAYEAERVRREYEESPEYRIGCEPLDGLTQELGISAEQAAALLSGSTRPESMEVLSRRAAATLAELERAGSLGRPAGEDLQESAFQKLMCELPAAAAVRVFEAERTAREAGKQAGTDAEQAVLEKIRARRSLPAPLRNAAPVSAEEDFANMSSEEFERFKQRYFSR